MGCRQNQVVGMREMGEMGKIREVGEKIYLNLPHLRYLHSLQKDEELKKLEAYAESKQISAAEVLRELINGLPRPKC